MARAKSSSPTSSAGTGAQLALPAPGDEDAFYIIDLSGYVFRAYHAIPPLSSSKGEPTHAVYGTTQMIKLLVDERKPSHLAIAMDSRGRGFRHDIDPRYKATRKEPPSDLAQQMARCEQIARAYRIPIFREDGLEADDLIATFVARMRIARPTMKAVIVSSDKDLMQLVDDRLVLWETMRNKVYGRAEVIEKFGVTPDKVRDLLALMGDSSDNVPGVPGVGPKTAADLIGKFGTIDAMYERIKVSDEGLRPKLRQALLDAEADARISQKLVTLKTDVPIDLDLDALRYEPPTGPAALELKNLFTELEFTRLIDTVVVAPTVVRNYRAITTRDDLEAFAREVRTTLESDPNARLSIGVEASSHRTVDADLVGVALAVKAGEGVYVPLRHRYLGVPKQVTLDDVRAVIGPLLADPKLPKVGHDLKFAIEILRCAKIELLGLAFDTLIAHYLLDPEAPHGLKELANSELGVSLDTYDKVTRKDTVRRGRQLEFDEVPIEEATPYAGAKADLARELAERFAPRIDGAGLTSLFRDVEMPLTEVLADLELAGVMVDVERMKQLSREAEETLREIEERCRKILSEVQTAESVQLARDFNIGSPRQLEAVLFDVLKLPVLKRTKTARSTDADVLEELAEKHPLPGVILEHRSLSKLKGTYLDAIPKLISPKTSRIHTVYEQHVAATGRLSSTDPNLQNIPIRTELGRKIRAAFIAPPGFVLMSADYSQIELRVLADLSKDPILIDAYVNGEDIHARTARELGLGGSDDKEARRRAKAVNFGVVYGQGDNALGKSLGIPRTEAASFIARYFERYAGVRRYMDEQIEIARRGEGVRTLLGRRRFLADIHSPNRMLRMQAERIARNTPIQGTAADILKLAMVALREPIVPCARMLLTVHDELVFEVPEDSAERAAQIVREKMAGVVKLVVPLVVDVGWGRTWADAHG